MFQSGLEDQKFPIDHAVNEDFKETKTILLFDYQNRDPLTNQATVYPITMNLIKNQ